MPRKPNEPIAVVGSACRFAGDATSPSKLWEVLRDPQDLVQEIPESRFSAQGFYHPDGSRPGHSNVSHAYLVNEDLSAFDAEFFGIKPVEAKAMDPQQRLLMEVAYEGLESAGLPLADLRGSDTAVYVGVMFNDYGTMLLRDLQETPTYYATGTGQSILSNRISYFFDWHGPSITIDTACSSSLVAVHMAIQALRAGDSRMALACGSNLILGPENFVIESKLMMLSPDGRSRMWDRDANGYARGDGVAALMLKTLSAALEDGDHIECVIRETALNQDGATAGITMPSPSAQEALIRSTYARAGLDLLSRADRPQYFEAHGTGTPAGDPTEAEAVFNAFYGSHGGDGLALGGGHPLYVGSIKTVLGHTEGTAGVAAILKASLALQHGYIPPNRLFDNLSDSVAPFYKNVEILRSAQPWPNVSGAPRRASVNSFGFGGANAHAIMESYDNAPSPPMNSDTVTTFTPFVFSAFSEQSLRASLSAYAVFLEEGNRPEIDPRDLAWTLRERRSAFPYRVPVTASSLDDLRVKVVAKLEQENSSIGVRALPSSKTGGTAKMLGIFTGQGAQYARMGAELIEKSETARNIMQDLESSLTQLPSNDAPVWSLQAEILADASSSRVHEAALSQPLCTAIQILLVDMLHLADVHFDAVVGHSSGEIAAAYAAGYLTARDAMRIAYYRGLHLQLASSPNGHDIKGAMVAVGSSMEDMTELFSDDHFAGRVTVASSNSSSSVTVSGDEDAIAELQLILEDEKKFNRRLKVDKAYHSKHMLPCFKPYVSSLRRCGIAVQMPPPGSCTWFSSVYNRPVDSTMALGDTYWAENMTRPVLFSETVTSAVSAGSYDAALEVGCHPALKGPASQTIQHVLQKEIPYNGLLSRGIGAVEASSAGLGFLWSYLGRSCVNLHSYERAMSGGNHRFNVVKSLPTYQWNHEIKHWHESRTSRKMRLRQHPVHSLLGDITSDSAPHHMSWRNLLRVSDMEWLLGHQVQNQVVFPASGYVTSALEAARFLAGSTGKDIRLIEVKDFTIHQAVFFDQDDTGVEILVSMAEITRESHPDRIRAKFTYSAALDARAEDLTLAASGDMEIHLGGASPSLLPTRKPAMPHVIDVEPERFYAALADLGYNFSGRFRSLSSLQRINGKATGLVKMRPLENGADELLIHPGELDAALQSVILAYSYPYDEKLQTMHLPTTIRQIRVNPALCGGAASRGTDEFIPVDSAIAPREADGQRGITGHVDLYSNAGAHAAIQIQGASFMPLGGAMAEESRRVFSRVHWIDSEPDGIEAARDIPLTERHRDMVMLLERISTFYLRKFQRDIPADHPKRAEFPTNWYLNYARYITDMVESGKHKWARKEWLNDTVEDVKEASRPFADMPDVQIMHLVGEHMPRVFRDETTILEQFRANDILDRYYAGGFGLQESAQWVGRTVKQVVDRYPHMNILEIGAGTGGATKAIFREIDHSYRSYTYTDISAAFFENAASVFSHHRDRMVFKTFDAEKDPLSQGYTECTYDLIVCFFVIHATSDLERALRHIRKLLKPGGFLVVGEGQEGQNGVASSGFIFGTLPGWWLGTDTGRSLSPHISPQEWDELLRSTGFSGVDANPPKAFEDVLNVFHFVSQAVDNQVDFLRKPLSSSTTWRAPPIKKLVIVGGQTARSSHFVARLEALLGKKFADKVYSYKTLVDVDYTVVDADSTVVSLTELDSPVFKGITPEIFEALKKMFESGKTLLWVTSGRQDDEPYSNMTVGFGRTATNETPDLCLQQLDITNPNSTSPRTIAEILLRLHATTSNKNNSLWAPEPEIVIDYNKRELVPRLRPIPELNDRYNSARRAVVRETNFGESPITMQPGPSGCVFKESSRYEDEILVSDHHDPAGLIELRTTHSVLSAIKTPAGHKFLVLGEQSGTKTLYLALVPTLASVLKIPAKSAVRCGDILDLSKSTLLTTTAAHLVSMTVLDTLYGGQTLVAHNPTSVIAQALATQAATKDVQVVYTTDSTDKDIPTSWIKLPRYLSQSQVGEILLAHPSSFVGLSDDEIERSENEATLISSCLAHCPIITATTIYSFSGSDGSPSTDFILGEALHRALAFAQEENIRAEERRRTLVAEPIRLDSLAAGPIPNDPLSIIDWTAATSLPIHVATLDARPMFKGSGNTYWIVGMSGALGISLTDWMISRGARNVVLTSRNPEIAPEWIASHRRRDATVTVIACDVTNEAALMAVHWKICEVLPPIVGVMNGAMVLRDTSIRNMSFAELTEVVRPKVDGSIYLDRIFSDTDLDFFVLVSSINCVIGNLGQANYAAANTFMSSLAAQRRKRGLRASTVNGGAIIGAGYMERESRRALDLIVQKLHMMRLSEDDWCQSICEAIDASRLDSHNGPELTTGLSDVPFDTPNAPYWFMNPKFSSFIVQQKAVSEDRNEGKETAASVQERLAGCRSQQDVEKVIEHVFAEQLRNVLQMTMSDDDLMASRGQEIGLDSLVSVDIRSWFLKNLQVSIPVLKIMGNDTMAAIVQHAVEILPAELVPQIGGAENAAVSDDTSDSTPTDPDLDSRITSAPTTPEGRSSPDGHKEKTKDPGTIDWEAESRVPADLADIPHVLGSSPVTPPSVIVLTGVSGLLGHHLLSYFLERTSAKKIVCLAVRRLASRLQKKELPSHPRVVYHEGNLSAPLLGLSAQEAADIFAEADVVVHNGADTSHLKAFPDLRASNVGSTVALARLCLPRRIPVHYVSSAGVAVLYNKSAFPEVSVTGPGSLLPAADGSFGYMCSKWVNERILEQVHDLYGLPVCIHRPSTIIREGDDATTARAQLDWVNALLHYARAIKAVPRVEHNRGALDLVYVQSACADVGRHILQKNKEGEARKSVTYVHEVGDIVLRMDRLHEIGLEEEGKPFDVLPIGEWMAKAVDAGLHPAVAALIEMMDTPGAPDYPRLIKGSAPS